MNFIDENGIEMWNNFPWDGYLEIFKHIGWRDKMILLKVHPHIRDRIINNFKPGIFRLTETDMVNYKMYKEILKTFGMGFHTIHLKLKDISTHYFHFCRHHNFYRFLRKIQKYCPNIICLELQDISLGCLEVKSQWPIFGKLKHFSISFNGRRVVEEIDEVLKHLKNLESLELYNVDLSTGWTRELDCTELKRVSVYYNTNSIYGDRLISYIDWQNLFEKHEHIEQWNCNYPVYRGSKAELKLNNLKQLTFSTLSQTEAMEWAYLKEVKTLQRINIITNNVENIIPLLEEILQNPTINIVEITETVQDLEITLPKDKIMYESLTQVVSRYHQLTSVILNTRYYRYLQKQHLRSLQGSTNQ